MQIIICKANFKMTSFAMIFWKRHIKCDIFTPKNLENSKQVSLVIYPVFKHSSRYPGWYLWNGEIETRESHCIFSSIILSHFGNDTRFSVIFLVKRNQVVSNCRVDQQLTFFVISPSWKNFPLPFLYLNRSDAWSH